MKVKGVILCGGEGKRLRPLTYYFQKTMIPIGSKQKPLLEYIVKLFRYNNIMDLVFLVGYKSEQIRNYFEEGSRFGVNIEYVEDPPGKRGSGHALLNAYKEGFFHEASDLLVYYGDILSDIDLIDLLNTHYSHKAYATLALAKKYQVPVGVAEMDGARIKALVEKPWLNLNATIGILALAVDSIEILGEIAEGRGELDIMGDFIPSLINRGLKVVGYEHSGFWYDVGTTEKYEKIDNHMIDALFEDIVK